MTCVIESSGLELVCVSNSSLLGIFIVGIRILIILSNIRFTWILYGFCIPFQGGVLFKGNLRGVPSKSYEKISKRLQVWPVFNSSVSEESTTLRKLELPF